MLTGVGERGEPLGLSLFLCIGATPSKLQPRPLTRIAAGFDFSPDTKVDTFLRTYHGFELYFYSAEWLNFYIMKKRGRNRVISVSN